MERNKIWKKVIFPEVICKILTKDVLKYNVDSILSISDIDRMKMGILRFACGKKLLFL